MTFDEAVRLKVELPLTFFHTELQFITYVTPAKDEDFSRYASDFRLIEMTDEFARVYSNDNQYLVRGICCNRDIDYFYYLQVPLHNGSTISQKLF